LLATGAGNKHFLPVTEMMNFKNKSQLFFEFSDVWVSNLKFA
jgi:hypothetical protein